MKRWLLVSFAVLIISLFPFDTAYAVNWPISVQNTQVFGPQLTAGGANTWCGRVQNGTYSSVFFSQPQAWVNYGGTCNACWGQPTNYIYAGANVYGAGWTVLYASGWVGNSYGSCYSQANAPYITNAILYGAASIFFDPSNGAYTWGGELGRQ